MTFESTAVYYNLINRHVRSKSGGRHSAPLLLFSVDQEEMIQHAIAGRWEVFSDVFVKAAKHQEAGGAQGIAMCMALAHKVAADLEREIGLPFLHLADYTGQAIAARGLKTVGLLATAAVMEGDFVKKRIEDKFGVKVLVPGPDARKQVNRGIFEELTTGKVSEETKSFFIETAKTLLDQGGEGLILGSTDLAFVIKEDDLNVPLFDTATLHATGIADWVLEQDKGI